MSRESLRSAGGNVSRRHASKLARAENAGDQRRHDEMVGVIRSQKGDQPVNSGSNKGAS